LYLYFERDSLENFVEVFEMLSKEVERLKSREIDVQYKENLFNNHFVQFQQ